MKILFKKRVKTIPLTLLVAILIYCMVTYLLSSSSKIFGFCWGLDRTPEKEPEVDENDRKRPRHWGKTMQLIL